MQRSSSLSLLTLALFGMGIGQAKAQLTLATDYDPSTNFNTNSGQPVRYDTGTYGYSFTVGSSPLNVTTLATAYQGANGNVRIYQDGTTIDVATAYITGLAAETANSQHGNPFGFTAITPVTLNANTTYDIVWDSASYGEAYSPQEPGYSYDPDVTFGSGISSFSVGDHPTTDAVGQGAYFGPSFMASAVPEPGSVALLVGLGMTGAAFLRRRKTTK